MSHVIFLLTAALSLFAVNYVRRKLRQQFLDIPNHRSSHKHPTPRGGGLGFLFAAIVGLVLYQWRVADAQTMPIGLWLTLLPLVGISVLDDWKSLKARTRYLVQLMVAFSIVLQTGPFPQPWLHPFGNLGMGLAFVMTVIGLTAFINFYNFMDGLDGLVAGVSLVQLSVCAIVFEQPVLWIVVAAVLGFLRWNWSPAKIFMGDAGSTVLGAVIAMTLLYSANTRLSQSPDLAWAYLVIAFPLIADALYTLGRRALRRENIFQAHRTHLYQRLHQRGWSHAQVATTYIAAACCVTASVTFLGNIGALLSVLATGLAMLRLEHYLSLPQPVPTTPTNAKVPYRSSILADNSERQ